MSTPSLSVRAAALAALLFALPPRAAAEEAKSAGDLTDAERERAVKEVMVRVDAAYQAALAAHAGETDRWFVARGVVADKSERTVRVDAFSTGLPPGSILEFLLITLNSGHDYEATFQTTALAADLARAFAFIGLPTGRPVAPGSFRFWPAGERVLATASVDGAAPIPLDAFAADAQTKAPLPETGFLYVGGAWKEDGTLTVDSAGPGSIVPTYNEPVTLFDLPRRAPQGTVYESITASTNSPAKPFLPVAIEFRPDIDQRLVPGVFGREDQFLLIGVIVDPLQGSFVVDPHGGDLAGLHSGLLPNIYDIAVKNPGGDHAVPLAAKSKVRPDFVRHADGLLRVLQGGDGLATGNGADQRDLVGVGEGEEVFWHIDCWIIGNTHQLCRCYFERLCK